MSGRGHHRRRAIAGTARAAGIVVRGTSYWSVRILRGAGDLVYRSTGLYRPFSPDGISIKPSTAVVVTIPTDLPPWLNGYADTSKSTSKSTSINLEKIPHQLVADNLDAQTLASFAELRKLCTIYHDRKSRTGR
jgi:hypothetical protein